MRTFLFLFFSFSFALTPNSGISQNVKIKIIKDQMASVDDVFGIMEAQTDYNFVYNVDLFKNTSKVNLVKGTIRASKLLDQVLAKTVFTYDFGNDKTIILKRRTEFIGTDLVELPQETISGMVTDVDGNAMPGVNVLIGTKGSTTVRGVATDFNGRYSINGIVGQVIRFSYIGYLTQEFTIEGKTELNVTMMEDVSDLSEVVITGYQRLSKERATGSFEKIDESQLEKPAADISERLVGMVAGLQSTVNADGSIDFEIRGQSSLFADQQPLVVYDGFPIEGGFNSINPNDVASITVLKDAAAASIWGAKSANGVIVITSKEAKKGKVNISVSSFLRASKKLDLDYVVGLASSTEVIEYEQRGFNTNFFGSVFGGPPPRSSNALGSFSQAIVAMNEYRLGVITLAERETTLERLSSLNNQGQIEKYLLQAPITKQYNVNISGGNETMLNSLSLMFEDSKEFFIGNNSKDYLINYKTSVKVANNVKFDFSGMMQYEDRTNNGVGVSDLSYMAPFDRLVNENGSLADMSYLKYYMPNMNAYVPMELFPYADWSYNPITEINSRDNGTKQLNTRVMAGLNYEPMEGLTLSSRILYEKSNNNTNSYFNEESFDVRQFINETSSPDWTSGNAPTPLVPSGGILRQNETDVTAYNFRNQANFVSTFADKHAVNVVLGSEISNRITKFVGNPDAFGYNDETLASSQLLGDVNSSLLWDSYPAEYARYFYSFNLIPEHQFTENISKFFSLYGNASYTYDNKYTVSGSYRTDASNLITDDPKYRYNPFWSVGLGWQGHKEEFMSKISWLDRLNVRATYGVNGNIDRSTSFKPLINLASSLDNTTKENTATVSSFGNPTLRWEKTKTFNLGIDFAVFGNQLNGTVNVYNKKGTDLIVDQSIASVNGTTSQKFNNGEMMNKGFEIQLGTTQSILGNDVTWRGDINFAHNKNEITSFFKTDYLMYNLSDGGTSSYVEGHDANTMWAFQYAGMHNFGSEASPFYGPSIIGDNGEKVGITGWANGNAINFMAAEGTHVAPTTLGMKNSFKIYDFDFSFIVTAKFGHVFRRQGFNYPSLSGGVTPVNDKYHEVANSDGSDVIPIPESEGRYFFYDRFYYAMNYLTEDAGHIRFQEINLTYNVPSSLTSNFGIKALDVYAQANNIGTILWNDFGEDPEFPKGTIKPQSTFTLGVQLNF